jgi:hypothetical protein
MARTVEFEIKGQKFRAHIVRQKGIFQAIGYLGDREIKSDPKSSEQAALQQLKNKLAEELRRSPLLVETPKTEEAPMEDTDVQAEAPTPGTAGR